MPILRVRPPERNAETWDCVCGWVNDEWSSESGAAFGFRDTK